MYVENKKKKQSMSDQSLFLKFQEFHQLSSFQKEINTYFLNEDLILPFKSDVDMSFDFALIAF